MSKSICLNIHLKDIIKVKVLLFLMLISLSGIGNHLNINHFNNTNIPPTPSPIITLVNHDSTSTLFNTDELLAITIIGDIKTIKNDISDNMKYHKAKLIYLDHNKDTISIKTKIKTRGQIRRSRDVCNFPPLKLKFDKSKTIGTIFSKNNKLKLVTHCQTGNSYYENYIIMEYLIYKMYQVISEESFRVRLVKITYRDRNARNKDLVKYGFLIEDDDDLAKRFDGNIQKRKNVHPSWTVKEKMNRLAIFQFMIGNLDWSVRALHNIKILSVANTNPIAIPYDFDYSGFVNASYAVPPEQFNLSSVKIRHYNGYCRTLEELNQNLDYFNSKKDDILDIIYNCEYLDEKIKSRKVKYIEEFYEIINDPKKVNRNFMDNCRD